MCTIIIIWNGACGVFDDVIDHYTAFRSNTFDELSITIPGRGWRLYPASNIKPFGLLSAKRDKTPKLYNY